MIRVVLAVCAAWFAPPHVHFKDVQVYSHGHRLLVENEHADNCKPQYSFYRSRTNHDTMAEWIGCHYPGHPVSEVDNDTESPLVVYYRSSNDRNS